MCDCVVEVGASLSEPHINRTSGAREARGCSVARPIIMEAHTIALLVTLVCIATAGRLSVVIGEVLV